MKTSGSKDMMRAGWRCARRLARLGGVALLALSSRAWPQEAGPGLDPKKALTQYRLDVWQTEQGLPQTTVYGLAQTADGYLWLGTQAGPVRFDGITFTTYDPTDLVGLTDRYTTAVLVDREGTLWFGTSSGGISRMRDGRVTHVEDDHSIPKIRSLYQDRNGGIWTGTETGLLRFANGKFRVVPGFESGAVYAIGDLADGSVLIATPDGVRQWRAGRVLPWAVPRGVTPGAVRSLLQDRKGDLWIGTTTGLVRQSGDRVDHFTARQGLPAGEVQVLQETRNGQLWIGTLGGGLARYRDGRFESLSMPEGLEGDEVSSIFEDREGSLWVGTTNGGLNRLRDPIVTTYGKHEGLPTDMLWSVYGDGDGTLRLGSNLGGLIRFQGGRVVAEPFTSRFPGKSAYATARASDGTLWVGGDKGLSRFRAGRWEALDGIPGAPTDWVSAIYADTGGVLWIGAGSGILRWKDGAFRSYTREAGLIKARIWTIEKDREGTLWFGTTGEGLLRYRSGKFTRITTREGLSNDVVHALHADEHGLWIGMLLGRVDLIRHDQVVRLPLSAQLGQGDLYSIQDDAEGNLWLSSNQGLYRVAKRRLLDVADGRKPNIELRRYSEVDGLRRTEFNGSGQNSVWKGPDGRLWYPSMKGLVVIDPNRLATNPLPPQVFVGRLLVDGREVAAGTELSLPRGGSGLEIHYTATSLVLAERVNFRYRLEGYDQGWVDAGHRRVAYYTGLPGGRYRFRVIAANNDGVWNEIGDTLAVRVKHQFHETVWFYGLAVCLAITLGAGLVRLRLRVAHRQSRSLAALVEERTAELRISQERYRELFDSNPLPVWVYANDTLAILAVNDAAIRHYGYSRSEFLSMLLTEIRPPEEVPALLEELRRGVNRPERNTGQVWHHVKKDGTVIAVEVMSHPIQFEGRPAAIVVVFDVTGRRDLEDRLRQAQKMEAIGELTGGIAHDLNNVLTAVIAHVDLAVATLGPQPDLIDDLTQAQSAAHRGAGIIRKLLGFGRRERLVRKPLDLGEFVAEFVATLRRLLPAHIEINVSADRPLPSVLADAGSVQQILLNLATNARDAMPGGGRLGIEVGLTTLDSQPAAVHGWGEAGAYVVVTVTDSGTGMDAATMARIFEPFYTTKSPGQGTGLGMAMVYGLMKQHEGYVSLSSEPGQGTRVALHFRASGETVSAIPLVVKPVIRSGHGTILLVEDEASVRTVATRALERFGYRVIVALDGEEGLRLWREHAEDIDLILSDAIMPRMGGLDLFEVVNRELPAVRFVLTSGYVGTEVGPNEGLPAGLAFLPKPWTVEELVAKVGETLASGPAEVDEAVDPAMAGPPSRPV